MNTLYEFKKEDAFRFAFEQNIQAKPHGSEIQFKTCPYCRSTKDTYTFAINASNGAFNCKRASCGATGNMITLAKDFNFNLSDDVTRYLNQTRYGGKTFRRFEDREIQIRDNAIKFMNARGISEEICRKYEITSKTEDESVIVFPFKDEHGKLVAVKYRNTDEKRAEKYGKEWAEKNCKPILFGMNHCNTENKTLVITEGQIDSLSLAEAGVENAVSVPTGKNGFTWVPYCITWMSQFEKIIVFGDFERGSISLLDEIRQRFHRTKQIYHVDERDYLDCKDANDILRKHGKEQIWNCINNAVPVPVQHIISLADVPDVDPENIERVTTGIYPLDRILDGGLPVGMLTLINGKTGEGKSCFANQMATYAKENGRRVLVYSGELSNEALRSQIFHQIAGPDFVELYENKYGKEKGRIKESVRKGINEWVRDFRLYDSTDMREDEIGNLVKILETAIQQYGVNYVVIDNLMTAIDLVPTESNSDKYEKQGRFVNRLASIAKEFNIVIVLVAHRRKGSGSQYENDEVMGSSAITNLAGVNIFYGKKTDDEIAKEIKEEIADIKSEVEAEIQDAEREKRNKNGHLTDIHYLHAKIKQEQKERIRDLIEEKKEKQELTRLIRVTKNRLTGECNNDGIKVDFHKASQRIYYDGAHNNLNDVFSWTAKTSKENANGFGNASFDEIPF